MDNVIKKFSGSRVIYTLASFIVLVAGLKAAKEILVPFVFALFLAFLGSAIVELLEKKRWPRGLAVAAVTLSLFLVITSMLWLFFNSMQSFVQQVPAYWEILEARVNELVMSLTDAPPPETNAKEDFDAVKETFAAAAKGALSIFGSFMVVTFLLSFMLMEIRLVKDKLNNAFGERIMISRFEQMSDDVQRYMLIKTSTSALTGLMVAALVWTMGVPYFVLWGILAFFLNFIPIVGSAVAAVPPLILIGVDQGVTQFLILGFGYLIINNVISNLIEPIFLGKGLGLSPLVVFLSLLFWGYVWGPAGMLVSIPLAMLLKIVFEHSDDFHWVSVLMADKVQKEV